MRIFLFILLEALAHFAEVIKFVCIKLFIVSLYYFLVSVGSVGISCFPSLRSLARPRQHRLVAWRCQLPAMISEQRSTHCCPGESTQRGTRIVPFLSEPASKPRAHAAMCFCITHECCKTVHKKDATRPGAGALWEGTGFRRQ